MKKLIASLLVLVLAFALCVPAAYADAPEGKVFNIYAWNEEFKGFFEKYYTVPEGVTVNWVIVPSDNGAYQDALDAALLNQADAKDDDKIDLFLAEADYILKYVDSDFTQDIQALGVNDFSNAYKYTVQAATDANGVVKGVSFQCCPSALIYRRSIAKDVLGTDDPAEVQAALSDWDKFNAVAADAKAKGYYMTASFAETFRPFSNNCTMPWVDADNNLQMDPQIEAWMSQTDTTARPCASSAPPGTSTSAWAMPRIPRRAAAATGPSAKAPLPTSGAAPGCSRLPAPITPPCSPT